MNAQQHFQQLARYNVWATQHLLGVIALLPDEAYRQNSGLFFKSIHGTLNHLLVGEHQLWFPRFEKGISPVLLLDAEAEPDRKRLAQRLADGVNRWQDLIATWPESRFDGELSYITMKGLPVALPFSATLAHVFNHGTHHRGQITAALTQLGQPGPVLDLVFMLQADMQTTNR